MPDNKNMLNDETLEKVSGGYLVDNWKEMLDKLAEDSRDKGKNYSDFEYNVLSGRFNSILTVARNQRLSKAEVTEIEHYLESIRW